MPMAFPCCCAAGPVCCVLPPAAISLTSYAWSGYEKQYQDAEYVYNGRKTISDLADYIIANPTSPFSDPCDAVTQATGIDIYKYITASTIPAGVEPSQTQRMVLVVTCGDSPFFCVAGATYEGAALFFADSTWNPTALVEAFTQDAIAGNMLVPYSPGGFVADKQFYYWQAPANADHMDAAFRAACPDANGSVRVLLTQCVSPGEDPIPAEFPLAFAPIEDQTYFLDFYGSPYASGACYTVVETTSVMPGLGVVVMSDVTGCEDAACA